jgi:hypothetical protein
VAPVPAGEPGVPVAGGGRDAPPAGSHPSGLAPPGRSLWRRALRALGILAIAYLAATYALDLALGAGVVGTNAVGQALQAGVAAVALFGLAGFGLTRLLLPAGLRSHEALWVLPVGACAVALTMTVLGFAYSPFHLSLGITIALSAALAVYAWRRAGPPQPPPRPAQLGWPFYLALLLVLVALIPMFRSGFATVIGDGSDAHLAVGTAHFLQHNYPTAVNVNEPVDQVPLVWRSKQPIYYALASVASLADLDPYQTIAVVAAIVLAMAAGGWYLVARELLGAGIYAGAAAMAVVGLDRIVLHTGMHPYFNQAWGYMTLPFALVLGWWAIRERTRGGLALLALFLLVGAFAYPLALPIPLAFLLVAWWLDRRARRRAGEVIPAWWTAWWRRIYRGWRSLVWMVPLAILLLIPIGGVLEKSLTAYRVIDPNASLQAWGGDLFASFPGEQYFGLSFHDGWPLAAAVIVAFAVYALLRTPRPLGWGLGAVLLFGGIFGEYFHLRKQGYYFEFKALAFTVPLAMTAGAVGMARVWRLGKPDDAGAAHSGETGRRAGGPPARWRWATGAVAVVLLGGLITIEQRAALKELLGTYDQLPKTMIALRDWDKRLPAHASVRLDVEPGPQLWVAYMLSGQRLCSQRPLMGTSYPHVPVSRKADYVIVERPLAKPFDAVGPVLMQNSAYRLYRLRPGLPGRDRCSRKSVTTVKEIGAI